MPFFTQESLEKLKQRIDLAEVLERHLSLKRSGSSLKALCPFHDERTPSFIIQKGESHYHCFGCGAHGDAIQFLMTYLHLSFSEAIESLAEQFHVPLDVKEGVQGTPPALLREALELAAEFYHFYLLQTKDGETAFSYLHQRGISENFIRRFQIGLAPLRPGLFQKLMEEKGISRQILLESGLITKNRLDFFRDRICFPIHSPLGKIIGFSGRKYKEGTLGGKYINSPETLLFKKSYSLFGLNYCRRRIVKQRRAVLVEGQIDCLRMIETGLNLTVAALGTAFGEGHVRELKQLNVKEIYLLFDGDAAGKAAASKTGDSFQKNGFQVKVASLPERMDPDLFLQKKGIHALTRLLENAEEYLSFQAAYLAGQIKAVSPSGKAEWIQTLAKQIRQWEDPVLIHESLKEVAKMAHIPPETIGVGSMPVRFIKKSSYLPDSSIDPHRILELDLLRWLLLMGASRPDFVEAAKNQLDDSYFWNPTCQRFFSAFLKGKTDSMSLMMELGDKAGEDCLKEIFEKKINKERAETLFLQTLQKLLDRQWMQKAEEIKMKIHSGTHSDEAVMALAKEFDDLKQKRPKVTLK